MTSVVVGARAKGRGGYPLGTSGSCDIKPLPLPQTGHLWEGTLWPWSINTFAYYSTSALYVLPLDHLRLHIEGPEPQAEVRGNAEEGLTYDDE